MKTSKATKQANATPAITAAAQVAPGVVTRRKEICAGITAAQRSAIGAQKAMATLALEARGLYTEDKEAKADFCAALVAGGMKEASAKIRGAEFARIAMATVVPDNASEMGMAELVSCVRELNPTESQRGKHEREPGAAESKKDKKGETATAELTPLQHLQIAIQLIQKQTTDQHILEIVADLVDIGQELDALLNPRVSRRASRKAA